MEKILIIFVMAIIILMPLSGAVDVTKSTTSETIAKPLTNGKGYVNITVDQAFHLYLSCECAGVQIPIDIRRTEDEFNEEHIETWGENQEPVNWPDLHFGTGLEEFMEEYAESQIVLYCRTANRTWTATKLLIANGFTGTIYHMLGGIKAWKAAGYPTAISVTEANRLLTSTENGIQIPIDIRTKREWNAKRIYVEEPQEKPVNWPNLHLGTGFDNFMAEYDDKETIIYCKDGSRSSEVVDDLIANMKEDVENRFYGYVHNMIGGLDAWEDAGLPTPTAAQLHSSPYSQTLYQVFLKLLGRSQNFFQTLYYIFYFLPQQTLP